MNPVSRDMGDHHIRTLHMRRSTLSSLSLRQKLLLFAASLVLVPGVLLVAIAERSARESLQQIIGRQLAREARSTADQLSAVLRSERETLANFARQDLMREVRVGDIDKRVSVALQTLRDGSPARLDYLVVDPEVGVVASSDPHAIGPLPAWADPRWMLPGAGDRLLGPGDTPLRDLPGVVMTTAIRDPDDPRRFLGTLVGVFDWKRLTAATDHVRRELASQGIAADVLVAGPDGSLIGGARSPEIEESDAGVFPAVGAGGGGRFESDYAVDASAGLIIGRASLASDLPGWRVLVVEPLSRALAPASRLSGRLQLTMGLALVAALALAGLAARRVVGPLSELTAAIRDLSRGGAGPVPVRSDDEVGTLAGAFNEMASELDRAQRELVEAEKFAFVGQLAAGVAHEIRTSLGVLGSSAQILERSLPEQSGEDAGELAGMIRDEVTRLGGVVNDLLTLDRARPLALEPTLLSMPLLRAADFVRPQAEEKGIRLQLVSATDEPTVLCEPELVYQVAVNLFVNALQAIGSGGCVEARVLGAHEGQGGFEVRDDGPGIPHELRERVFQPFVTGRDGGVGVGLTFVKRVVHDHRGVVTVECPPGGGTLVRVRLPCAGDAP
jgi:two-component system sensor histidine kinase HydH